MRINFKFTAFFLVLYAASTIAQPVFDEEEKPYFQQEVNYTIDVKLNDDNHTLEGEITIEYTNNSPDRLNYIYMHLWPNAYKDINSAMGKQLLENGETGFYYSKGEERGYIDGLRFNVDGQNADWEFDRNHDDIAIVYLPKPVLTGEKVSITTPFHVKIPVGKFSRLGHIKQSYQITQWYPKPAVYDRDGWHPMPYLNQGEFYSEYGSFDVSITVPENYVVGATGILQNEEEIKWLNEKAEATAKKNEFPDDNSFPASSDTLKTLRYTQDNIHDFAWFADKRYHVLKKEFKLPKSGRKVTAWSMFTNRQAELWKNSTKYISDATRLYSEWIGEYPYDHVTAVDGALSAGGGMEYPMITVIGSAGNDFSLERVIMHEVGHNWFYGILGSNERDNPWMDEGMNSYYENRYIATKYPEANLIGKDSSATQGLLRAFNLGYYSHKAQHYLLYLANARRNRDQAIDLDADEFTSMNYGAIVYGKTALSLEYLESYLGRNKFDQLMQEYYEQWKFKHPQPADFIKIFEEQSDSSLLWFFDDLLSTKGKIDYKIVRKKDHQEDSSKVKIKIRNKGDLDSPFSIHGVKDNKIISSCWYNGFPKKSWVDFPEGNYDFYHIDATKDIPEINRSNNKLKEKGLFKKTEPLRLQFLGGLENPDRTQLFYAPMPGWNNYDKFMAGLLLHNFTLPVRNFEFALAPMYGFGSKKVTGFANANYHFYPKRLFQHITAGVSGRKFSYLSEPLLGYRRIVPHLDFVFDKIDPRKPTTYSLTLQSFFIREDFITSVNAAGPETTYNTGTNDYLVNNLLFNIDNNQSVNPYHVSLNIEQGENFVKTAIDANYRFSYKGNNQGFDIRFYIGRFLHNEGADSRFNFTFSNMPDYLYDELYLGRTETSGLLNQQFYIGEGGFKNPTTAGSHNRWLNAINLKSTLPKVPLALYLDAGLAGSEARDGKGNLIEVSTDPLYNGGVALQIIPDFFEIYCPVVMSGDLNQLTYWEKIRFTLNLSSVRPFEMLRNISF